MTAMTMLSTRGRKIFAGLLTASVLGAAVAPTAASAGPYGHHHGRHGDHWGYGAAGFGGGLLIGALAANAASEREVVYERRCWVERRRIYDDYGNRYIRRIRVCD
ncbi:hypothetical protein [Hansschlegelia plantiphila]|uniref:Lectin-like protein BA14k n=1 Tax=Hansschlegelia plantiphila TaxID=374655 RepID=A0A9W6MVR5_9HYPH|nr:hypothetical protein [Hansschlegelia plantiphila]GLK68186.1 hypothetical protein GCM10008179_18240 [Hansschlegelia plantiphila]